MGVDPAEASGAIRVSFGWASTSGDVDRLVAAWHRLYARTRRAERQKAPEPA
jgi:cysteine desulfurase